MENGDCPDFRVNENGTVPFAVPEYFTQSRRLDARRMKYRGPPRQDRRLLSTPGGPPRGDCPDFRVNENGTVPFAVHR
jgi:hypothetical protein